MVAFAAADVKHLYDAPYNKETVFTTGTLGSASSTGPIITTTKQEFVSTPIVTKQEFISTPVVTKQEFIAPVTTTFVNQGSVAPSTGFISTTSSGSGNSGLGLGLGSGSTQYTTTTFNGGNSGSSGLGLGQRFGGSSGSTGFSSGSGFGSSSGSSFSGSAFNGGSGAFHDNSHVNVAYNTKVVKQTKPLVSKASYVFAAPEDNESFQHDQEIVLPRPRQHYNVIFVKAPSTTIVNTPSAAVGGKAQEKTLVYVLTDKQRIENRIEVPEVDQAKLQKPEVFFVKNNKPTEVVNSKIKYETVEAINGAENGALNGVPNKVSGNGALLDEYSNPEAAQVAQTIYQAVQTGGLESGIHTIDNLSSLGYSIGGNYGGNYGNGGAYNTGSTTYTTGSNFGSRGSFAPSGSVSTTEFVSGPSTTYGAGYVAPASQTTYTTGYVAPVSQTTYSTGYVAPASQTSTTYNTGFVAPSTTYSEGYKY